MSDSIQLPWPTFPEEFVIGELLQTSSEFQRFYREEREKIVRRIYWARDLTLSEGIDHRNTRIKWVWPKLVVVTTLVVPSD